MCNIRFKLLPAATNLDESRFLTSALPREGCCPYPGDIEVSGQFEGRAAIEKWFKNLLEQFPRINFTIKNICLDNVLDFVGTNTVVAHWDLDVTNRDGKEIQNSGITVIKIKFGKVQYVKDFLFDTGPKWRTGWGVE